MTANLADVSSGFLSSVDAYRKKTRMNTSVTSLALTRDNANRFDSVQAMGAVAMLADSPARSGASASQAPHPLSLGRRAARSFEHKTARQPALVLPVDVCVSLTSKGSSVQGVCWGGGPEDPSASLSDFGLHPRGLASTPRPACTPDARGVGAGLAAHQDLSWGSPGGVRLTTRVNSRNAVRWPAIPWRSSRTVPSRRNRASARISRSAQTRGGAR